MTDADTLQRCRDALRRWGWSVGEKQIGSDEYHGGHVAWEVTLSREGIEQVFRRVWLDNAYITAVQWAAPLDLILRDEK